MDPFKGQGGIQMLLSAEQEAQHIVSNARNCKTSNSFIQCCYQRFEKRKKKNVSCQHLI